MKDAIAASYCREMMQRHAEKPMPAPRHAIVVGVDPGNIGDAIAARLLKDGINVWACNKSTVDVRQPKSVSYALNRQKDCDTLILCNGITHLDWIEDQPPDVVEDVISATLTGSIIATSGFVRHTLHKPFHKHLVFIGSMAYNHVLNASAPYCAAKAGLAHFTRCMGWELAPKGYSVFCVHPSNTEGTPMTEETIRGLMRYRRLTRVQAEAYWGAVNVQPRWLQASDVAETVSHLVSGRARYLTGTNLELSGGQR